MTAYQLSLIALFVATVAQTSATWMTTESFLRDGQGTRQRSAWLGLALAAALLTLHHAHTLELALRTGLYDLQQAVLAMLVGLLLALGLFGLKPPSA